MSQKKPYDPSRLLSSARPVSAPNSSQQSGQQMHPRLGSFKAPASLDLTAGSQPSAAAVATVAPPAAKKFTPNVAAARKKCVPPLYACALNAVLALLLDRVHNWNVFDIGLYLILDCINHWIVFDIGMCLILEYINHWTVFDIELC